MNEQEMEAVKSKIKEFINDSTDEQFDRLVAEANKLGFRELARKLMIVWVAGAKVREE